jgi:uncharacterized protein (TIGR03435 family)
VPEIIVKNDGDAAQDRVAGRPWTNPRYVSALALFTPKQIEGGPKWADATKYDIEATPGTPPAGTTVPPTGWTSVRFEVQALLKDRFQLKLDRQTKTVPTTL